MTFDENKKSYMDSLFSISTLLKRWHTEIHKKDVDKNYMISKLNDWIKKLQELKQRSLLAKRWVRGDILSV